MICEVWFKQTKWLPFPIDLSLLSYIFPLQKLLTTGYWSLRDASGIIQGGPSLFFQAGAVRWHQFIQRNGWNSSRDRSPKLPKSEQETNIETYRNNNELYKRKCLSYGWPFIRYLKNVWVPVWLCSKVVVKKQKHLCFVRVMWWKNHKPLCNTKKTLARRFFAGFVGFHFDRFFPNKEAPNQTRPPLCLVVFPGGWFPERGADLVAKGMACFMRARVRDISSGWLGRAPWRREGFPIKSGMTIPQCKDFRHQ